MEILKYLLALFALKYCAAINDHCPDNLTKDQYLIEHEQSCYQFMMNRPGTWHDAQRDCRAKGGHLADIHTFKEQGFLYTELQTLGGPADNDKGLWIGLNDEAVEGTFVWESGAAATFFNWESGQPGILAGSEDCVLLEYGKHGGWHDYPCDGMIFFPQNHGWICEFDIVNDPVVG